MGQLSCLLSCLLLCANCYAQLVQQKDISGSWYLVKIENSGKLLFDRYDSTVAIRYYYEMIEEYKNTLSGDNWQKLREKVQGVNEYPKRQGYKFSADSVFMIDADGQVFAAAPYTFDFSKQKIFCNLRSYLGKGISFKTIFLINDSKLVIRRGNKKGYSLEEYVKEDKL